MGVSLPPIPAAPVTSSTGPSNIAPEPGTPPNAMRRLIGAMTYLERKQEVVANNVANVSTAGFKQERVFAQLLGDAIPVAGTRTDLRNGALKETNNPLDIGLEGPAFLVVRTPQGERLSRGGSFRLDEQRRLVDPHGNALLLEPGVGLADASGTLRLPVVTGPVQITRDGSVFMGDPNAHVTGTAAAPTLLGRLRLDGVADDRTLQHEAGTLFRAEGARVPLVGEARRVVVQGFLEESNVNAMESMVDMIAVQRRYADMQKAATTLDAMRGIMTELARP